MEDFVSRLWSNPSIEKAPLIKKENQILSFLKENVSALQQAFAKPDFFPGMSWEESMRLFLTVLTDRVQKSLEPIVDAVVENTAQPALIDAFKKDKFVSLDKEKFKEFIKSHIRSKTLRDPYVSVIECISFGFFEKYIPHAIERRKVIYNEVVRRDRLTFDSTLIPAYLNLCALFRPIFFHKFPRGAGASKQMVSLQAAARDAKMYDALMKDLEMTLNDEVGFIPEKIVRTGVDSFLNFYERPEISGASRLIAIMASRSAEYDPNIKVDKGAETPDKSWFNINRKTAKYYGYDVHLLEELYQIAGEEGW